MATGPIGGDSQANHPLLAARRSRDGGRDTSPSSAISFTKSSAGGSMRPCTITLSKRSPGLVEVESVPPQRLDIGEAEGREPGRGFDGRASETAPGSRPRPPVARAAPCNSPIPVPISHTRSVGPTSSAAIIDASVGGRRRGLAAADRQGDVPAGDVGEALRHEERARHALERAQKVQIVDPPRPHREGELGALLRFRCAHAGSRTVVASPRGEGPLHSQRARRRR